MVMFLGARGSVIVPEAGLRPEGTMFRTRAASTPKEHTMNATKLAAVALIAAGVLALVYGSFSYTRESHELKLGPIELSMKEKQTVNVPVWAGVAAIVVGGALLLIGGKK
jgi:uncharacterized membrane protein YidH (DUF202 family)